MLMSKFYDCGPAMLRGGNSPGLAMIDLCLLFFCLVFRGLRSPGYPEIVEVLFILV
jgi:hypothetical protein